MSIGVFMIAALAAACAVGAPTEAPLVLKGGGGQVTVDARSGEILSANGIRSGARGLWRIRFRNGEVLQASDFNRHPEWTVTREGNRFAYRNDKVEVLVGFDGGEQGVDVRGVVSNMTDSPVMDFELPARLFFDPKRVDRFFMPQRGNAGPGFAFKRSFFEETSSLRYPSWRQAGPRVWKKGTLAENDARLEQSLASAIKASARPKVGFIVFPCGPEWGALSKNVVGARRELYGRLVDESVEIVDLRNSAELTAALASDEYRFVFNAFCDFVPLRTADDVAPTVAAIKAYEARGGRWVSAAPAESIAALVPGGYYSYSFPYPNLFMDFCQLRTTDGAAVAVFGVRPRPSHAPWACPSDCRFVPGEMGVGGSEKGGYLDRSFRTYVRKGERFAVPVVRFSFEKSLDGALSAYTTANDLVKPLSAKASPKLIETLRQAPVVTIYSTRAKRCAEIADLLPAPSVIHLTGYLKGGFDKEYPDHLPTNEKSFGTDADHVELIRRLHRRGHLYMPYTNPTWWCDHPRGPTFQAAGEAPLLVRLDGKHNHEVYKNEGWTTCFWHPAVIAANRRTIAQFTSDFAADLVFQDQCGARRFCYDLNPSAPSPLAYTEGLLSQLEEDAARVPLGTEDGWDKVSNEELCIFGMSWQTIPRRIDYRERRDYHLLTKELISPETWEIEPLALRLMHDKCFFYCHNLSGCAFDHRLVAWNLALGYNLIYDATDSLGYAGRRSARAWDRYVAALQNHVVRHVAGAPLGAFRHDRSPLFAGDGGRALSRSDDGLVEAAWGNVRCTVNLGDVPRAIGRGVTLAPYGYIIEGPGVRAEYLQGSHPKIFAPDINSACVIDDNGALVCELLRNRAKYIVQ